MRFLRIFISLVLVATMLCFTSGFSIAKHYCKAELVDVAINSDLEKCGDAEKYAPLPEGTFVKKKSCCRDEYSSFKLVQHHISGKVEIEDYPAPAIVVQDLIFHKQFLHEKNIWHLANPPPAQPISIYKVIECYRI